MVQLAGREYFIPYGLLCSLPETGSLPSARWFAKCNFSGTRQRSSLPSAKKKHSANKLFAECFLWHSAKKVFAECFTLALGKESLCRVFLVLHTANKIYKAHFDAVN